MVLGWEPLTCGGATEETPFCHMYSLVEVGWKLLAHVEFASLCLCVCVDLFHTRTPVQGASWVVRGVD